MIIVTVIFSRYFVNHVADGRRWLWGTAVAVSMIIAALLSPPLGAAADSSRSRKKFLLILTLISIACTALLPLVGHGAVLGGMVLFILANIGFEGGLVFYDAFLPGLTTPDRYGRVSGFGFAMGYVGALAVLLTVNAILGDPADPGYLDSVRSSFLVAAVFFLIFSLPIFLFVPEPPRSGTGHGAYIREGFRKAGDTLRAIFRTNRYLGLRRFLIAFFLYNDAIITVITFAAIFAEETLRMNDKDIILFFAIVQTSAVLGSFAFGLITDRIGPRKTVIVTLVGWIGITVGAYFVGSVPVFYVIGLCAGIAIGATQSASRSLMALLTPAAREAEFFGFYDGLCGKSSAVIGPIAFGILSDLAGARVAVLSLSLFFVAGLILMRRVTAESMT